MTAAEKRGVRVVAASSSRVESFLRARFRSHPVDQNPYALSEASAECDPGLFHGEITEPDLKLAQNSKVIGIGACCLGVFWLVIPRNGTFSTLQLVWFAGLPLSAIWFGIWSLRLHSKSVARGEFYLGPVDGRIGKDWIELRLPHADSRIIRQPNSVTVTEHCVSFIASGSRIVLPPRFFMQYAETQKHLSGFQSTPSSAAPPVLDTPLPDGVFGFAGELGQEHLKGVVPAPQRQWGDLGCLASVAYVALSAIGGMVVAVVDGNWRGVGLCALVLFVLSRLVRRGKIPDRTPVRGTVSNVGVLSQTDSGEINASWDAFSGGGVTDELVWFRFALQPMTLVVFHVSPTSRATLTGNARGRWRLRTCE